MICREYVTGAKIPRAKVNIIRFELCTCNKLLFCYRWLQMRFDHSRSFKVTDFCLNYDFLSVIICDLGSIFILHRFRDKHTARREGSWKPRHPIAKTPSNSFVKLILAVIKVETFRYLFCENRVDLASGISLQYTSVTDDRDNIPWQ